MGYAAESEPSGRGRGGVGVAVTVFTLLFLALMVRFFHLQILHGEDYRERARISFIGHERIPARRGLLKDRNGTVLAENQPSYRVTITPHYVADEPVDEVLERIAGLLHLRREQVDTLRQSIDEALESGERWNPVVVKRDLVGDTCPYDGTPLELVDKPARQLFCPTCGQVYGRVDAKAKRCPYDGGRLRWRTKAHEHAVCRRCGRGFVTAPVCPTDKAVLEPIEHNLQCSMCSRTFTNEVATLRAQLHTLPGVEIHTSFRRKNAFHFDAAHTLGYMSLVRRRERQAEPGVYELRDRVGRTGAERAFEPALRGTAGESLYLKGNRGRRLEPSTFEGLADDVEFRRAEPGSDVWLTIDLPLQRAVRKAFRFYGRSGAAVAVDPRTGEVLAAYSKPGFDPNVWSGTVTTNIFKEATENPYSPLVNKALTAYHPGSVYKIVTALAGLEEGVIDPEWTVNCPGYYDYLDRRFHCHHRSGHGYVNLVDAIKHSCDVYFYKAAQRIGMDTLAAYARKLGFGEPTGVMFGEGTGRVPTRAYHESTELGWLPGLTLSTGIGQGAVTASPLQVARAYSALANGGSLLLMRYRHQYVGESGDVVRKFHPQVERVLDFNLSHMALVREGLVRVVNDADGTAKNVRLDDIVMAGKTGTAEAAEFRRDADPEMARWLRADHAWFVAYAPAEAPEIVVVVFVEHGGSGSQMAAPVAQRIVREWMRLGMYEGVATAPPDDEVEPVP